MALSFRQLAERGRPLSTNTMYTIVFSVVVVGCSCWKLPAIPSGQRSQYYTQQSDGSYKFGYDSVEGLHRTASDNVLVLNSVLRAEDTDSGLEISSEHSNHGETGLRKSTEDEEVTYFGSHSRDPPARGITVILRKSKELEHEQLTNNHGLLVHAPNNTAIDLISALIHNLTADNEVYLRTDLYSGAASTPYELSKNIVTSLKNSLLPIETKKS